MDKETDKSTHTPTYVFDVQKSSNLPPLFPPQSLLFHRHNCIRAIEKRDKITIPHTRPPLYCNPVYNRRPHAITRFPTFGIKSTIACIATCVETRTTNSRKPGKVFSKWTCVIATVEVWRERYTRFYIL